MLTHQKVIGDTSQERTQKHPGINADYFCFKQTKLEMAFCSPQKLSLEINLFSRNGSCQIYCMKTLCLYKLNFRYIEVVELANIKNILKKKSSRSTNSLCNK